MMLAKLAQARDQIVGIQEDLSSVDEAEEDNGSSPEIITPPETPTSQPTTMLAKLAQTARDQLGEAAKLAQTAKDVGVGVAQSARDQIDEAAKLARDSLPSINEADDDDPPMTPTNPETPSNLLRKIRSPSILLKETAGSLLSLASLDSDSSHSDSRRCNQANMPNKITGEMGIQIFPCPDGTEEIILKYVNDRHFQYVHPDVFAPAYLVNVERMGGGGSGVSVFSGTHPELGEIVMKHGGFGDMKELFALGTIASELTKRGSSPGTPESSKAAAARMKSCLPEFKMVYISPQHVLYKQKAVWGKLKKLVKIGQDRYSRESFASLTMKIEMSEKLIHIRKSSANISRVPLASSLITLNDSKFLGPGASIRVYQCDTGKTVTYLEDCRVSKKPCLNIVVPKDQVRSIEPTTLALASSDNCDPLRDLYEGLSPLMKKHLFNFTLAQKRIGGPNAKTGSQWLYEGKLNGQLLDNLIAKFVDTVRNLQALTSADEVDVAYEIREEIQQLRGSDVTSDALSTLADQFMGNAIKKNFHPTKGRIRFLRKTCEDFRENNLYLEKEEVVPARHLGTLGEPGAFMSDVFVGASSEPVLFHPDKDFWINLMVQATSDLPDRSPNATKRVWTSGLCDAGVHNLFVCEKDLCFFDLGVPQLQSLPGFMTKFLFSFFHTLGMEEDENSEDNEWVRRFVVDGDKLALTQETTDLLPKAYDAFCISLDRIIEELFDGDQSLRWLLLQYVTLQLLSDASFCLQRWQLKGGGHPRDDNQNEDLEQWLWRALWDTYVAFDINTIGSWERLHIEQPLCHESNASIGAGLRDSIRNSMVDCDDLDLDELRKLDEEMDTAEDKNEQSQRISTLLNSKRSSVQSSFEKSAVFSTLLSPKRSSTKAPFDKSEDLATLFAAKRSSATKSSWEKSQDFAKVFASKRSSTQSSKRSSTQSSARSRWSSDRLHQSTLRELTAATFEYSRNESYDYPSDSEEESDTDVDFGASNAALLATPLECLDEEHNTAE